MKNVIIVISISILISCKIGAGTLGGFETWYFPISKKNVQNKIDSLFIKYPNYTIPEKWKYLDDWSKSGYDFLESKIFYFKNEPEEMYYVTFVEAGTGVENPDHARIAVRAVNCGKPIWLTVDDFSNNEKNRIQRRFYQEIILKIEKSTGVSAVQLKRNWYE